VIQQAIVNLNGLRFNAFSVGPAEKDAVILLHGFPQFADAWTNTMHALAASGLQAQASKGTPSALVSPLARWERSS
jgi:hypothetical protein